MKRFIQYKKKTGAIQGWVDGDNKPEIAKDLPIAILEVETSVDPRGMRVNKNKELEPCPIIARQNRKGELQRQLSVLDVRRGRAMEDFILDDDKTSMQKIRDEAAPLRQELSEILAAEEADKE